MSTFKSWAMTAVLSTAAVFIGTVAEAAPVTPTTFEQEMLEFNEGQSNQLVNDDYFSLSATSLATASFVYNDASFLSFGIFDAADPLNRFQLFDSNNGAGEHAVFGMFGGGTVFGGVLGGALTLSADSFAENLFGFYVETVNGVLYSDASLNGVDGNQNHTQFGEGQLAQLPNFVAGPWLSSEYLMSWGSDPQSPTFGVVLSGVSPASPTVAVAEPMTALMMLMGGMIGFGFRRQK